MPYHKNNPQATQYRAINEIGEAYLPKENISVIVPALDLTSLMMEDETDTRSKEPNKNHTKEDTTGGNVLFRKQKMPFVFPSEKSISDIDVIRGTDHYSHYEEPYYITSVSSYRTNSLANEPLPEKETHVSFEDGTISFSLSNSKFSKYIHDVDVAKPDNKETMDYNHDRSRVSKSTAFSSGSKPATSYHNNGATDNTTSTGQQDVYDVVVVNGQSKNDNHEKDIIEDGKVHKVADGDKETFKDKPKARVTFSFTDADLPSGRYTPIKGDVRIQLQSVLKKRKTPSPVLQRSCSEDRARSRQKHSAPIVNNESIRLFGSSYTLDYRFGYYATGAEHGIPVKHVHTTNADLERHTKSSATTIVDKPPIPSANRITLSMAEKSATSGHVRGMPSRETRLSASHMRGRMAYFRTSEKARSTPNQNGRSRSSDDLHSLQTRSNTKSNTTTSNNAKANSTMPFALRRCASSERDLLVADNNNRQRPKPKIAFGSFILPKEASSRAKATGVQFHDLNPVNGHIPIGTYVHTHTRRSPYAAPTQVLLTENRKPDVGRRPATGSAQTRQLKQPQQQHYAPPDRNHAQRHSAPSSFGHIKEKTIAASHPDRISINTSPAKAHFPRPTVPANEMVASNGTTHLTISSKPNQRDGGTHSGHTAGFSGQVRSTTGLNADSVSNRRAKIAELNLIANKDRGVSHHQFITKLQSCSKDGS